MSIDNLSVIPRNQYISQIALAVFELYRLIFIQREETRSLSALLGLILTVPPRTRDALKAQKEKIEEYERTGNFDAGDVWRIYGEIMERINKDILNDVVYGFVPASAVKGARSKPTDKTYEPKLSDRP